MQVQREQSSCQPSKFPRQNTFICVDSTLLIKIKLEKACTREVFCEKHNLDVDVHNVFVESSRFHQSNLENTQILDVILEDQVSSRQT